MNLVGGDILEVFCSHSELGDFRFYPKANESYTLDKGGISTSDDENGITGGGDIIQQMNRRRWSFEGPIAVDFAAGITEDAINNLAESPILGTWTISHISGASWVGKGKPVGVPTSDTNTAILTLKVAGSNKLETI